jgi:hypothetical protein
MIRPLSNSTRRRDPALPGALRVVALLAAAAATTLVVGCYRRHDQPVAAAPAAAPSQTTVIVRQPVPVYDHHQPRRPGDPYRHP